MLLTSYVYRPFDDALSQLRVRYLRDGVVEALLLRPAELKVHLGLNEHLGRELRSSMHIGMGRRRAEGLVGIRKMLFLIMLIT